RCVCFGGFAKFSLMTQPPLLAVVQGGERLITINSHLRGGWFKQPLIFWTNTTPSAPSKVASQHFLDGAATPPQLRRGIRTHVSLPRHTRGRSLKLKASMLLLLTKSSPKCPNSMRVLKPATTSLAT